MKRTACARQRMLLLRRLLRTTLVACLASVATCASVARVASADEAGDTANARALGIEGVLLANAGKCADAVKKLERAEALHHAPTTATRLGECEIELGKLVRGTERLQRVVREPLPPGAHGAFVVAVARAHKALDATLPRLATLRIAVVAPAGTKLAITVDGEALADVVLDTDRPIDPGAHTIRVAADGFLPSSITESLEEGQSKRVALELHADPNARALAAAGRAAPASSTSGAPAAPATEPPPMTAERGPSKVPAVLLIGTGAVGLGLGIGSAVIVDHKTSALSSGCDANKVCPSSMQGDLQAARTWATVSTIGFIGGGALAATGLVLLLVAPPSSGSSEPAVGARVRPVVGATSLGLDGVF
jgi:hypothetical protein